MSDVQLLRPVFLAGPTRSGSSMLHHLLAMHEDAAFVTSWSNQAPSIPAVAAGARLNDLAGLERRCRGRRFWPKPWEAYGFWDHCIPGFSSLARDMQPAELRTGEAECVRCLIGRYAAWQGKPRFVTKYTGWPRFALMKHLFPQSFLVYIDRYPLEVVYSAYKMGWYDQKGWRWPEMKSDEPAPRDRRGLLEYYAKRHLRYHEAFMASREQEHLYIRYEDMVGDFRGFMRALLDRIELPWTRRYERFIATVQVRPSRNAYLKDLDRDEIEMLHRLLDPVAHDLGYDGARGRLGT